MSEQAAEAREQAADMRELHAHYNRLLAMSDEELATRSYALMDTAVRFNEAAFALADTVDALSVRLAQAEQALHDREIYAFGLEDKLEAAEVRLRVTDALKREYEEALKQIAALPYSKLSSSAVQQPPLIARAVLAASGGREA